MKLQGTASVSALAAVAVGATAVAFAEAHGRPERQQSPPTELSALVKVTPSKAGTKQDPRGVTIGLASTIATERGSEAPIVTGFDLSVGQGFAWNGGAYVACSKPVLDRLGPTGCPRESIMGSGVASANAGGVATEVAITFVNGGARRLLASIRFEYPARVQETIAVKATQLDGKWSYKYAFRAPKRLQVVAGVPVRSTGFRFTLGGKPYARRYVATTSCPQGGWTYRITAHYRYDSTGQTAEDTDSGAVACTS